MNVYQPEPFFPEMIFSCITILMFLFLSSLTLRAGKAQRENQLFTIMCMLQLIHHISIALNAFLTVPASILFVYRAVHVVQIFMLPVSVHYIHKALNLKYTQQVIVCVYGAILCLLPFVPSAVYLSDAPNPGSEVLPSAGPLFIIFILSAVFLILWYAILVIIRLVRPSGNADNRMKLKSLYLLCGLAPALILTLGDALPLLGINDYSAGRFVFIPMGVFTYGILRHQVLDNKGWFSVGYIPNFLTAIVWSPVVLSFFFCLAAGGRYIHTEISGRLFPEAVPPILSCLVCFSLATLCFQKGRRQIQTMLFGGICALWGLLNLDVTLLFILSDKTIALQINRFDHFFLVMQLGFYVHFLHYFSGVRKWLVYLNYLISLVFMPLTQSSLYLVSMYEYPWGLFAEKGILFDVMVGIALINIMAGCILLLRKIRESSGNSEHQKQYLVFLCGAVSMALLGITNVPAMSGVDIYPFGSFMFIPVMLMAYGVFRYDLVIIDVYTKKRLWAGISIILTWIGYGFLLSVGFVILTSFSPDELFGPEATSRIPQLVSFCICCFFSVLSLRVGHTLTGARLFGLICMVYAFLSVDILLNSIVGDPETGLAISRLSHSLLVLWPGLHIHLVYLICRKQERRLVWFCYGVGILIALSTQSIWYLSGMVRYSWGLFAQKGPVFDLFCCFAIVNVLYSLWLFYQSYHTRSDRLEKHRLLLFALGLGAAAVLTAGNLPAMNGYDLYPAGNFIFFPIAVFGYAMFRKNRKETLLLLNNFFYLTGVLCILFLTALFITGTRTHPLPSVVVFFGLAGWMVLFKGYDRIWKAILSLFFGQPNAQLNQEFIKITDLLSKSRTLNDIVNAIAGPVFNELYVQRFCVLFHDPERNEFQGILNVYGQAECIGLVSLPDNHPVFALFGEERDVVTQEQVETWIINTGVVIAGDDLLRRADIIQPVFSDSSLISVLLLYGKEDASFYSENEKEFISRIGFSLGPYIENAKLLQGLEEEVEKRTGELRSALSDITLINHFIKTVNASLNLDDIMNAFTERFESVFRFDALIMQLVDTRNEALTIYNVYGNRVTFEQKKQLESLSVSLNDPSSLSVKGVRLKKRIYENRYYRNDSDRVFEAIIHMIIPFSSIVILPMDIRNEVIGNIVLVSGTKTFDFESNELDKIQGYVSQIASAVNNARLYDKAEAAVQVKSEFLSRMSHEIRSPLNAILGMGDLLSETSLNKEQRDYVEIFMNSGGLLLSVVNDILDFSKIEAGQVDLESIPFDLYRLLGELKDIISVSSQKKGLDVKVEVSPEVNGNVCGDPVRLSQVLLNLADNAVRFTDKGGITIRVSRAWNNSRSEVAQFCVEDTGIGIAEEKRSLIFESFSQEEDSTTRKYGGTGLGLTISKKLIRLMGGTISVESDIGRGSRFYFTVRLPATDDLPDSTGVPKSSVLRLKSFHEQPDSVSLAPRKTGKFSHNRPRLLLAEDIQANIRVVELYLKSVPVALDVAGNGSDAVRMYRKNRYDLVLMDIHMPVSDGYDATQQIREWERHNGLSKTPVVALSAHVPDESTINIIDGFDAFLMKPFSRQALISTMTQLIGPIRSEDQHGIPESLFSTIDPDYVDIIPVLIKEILAELTTIEISLEREDYPTVYRLSHGFKGAAGNCGLKDLSEQFKILYNHAVDFDFKMVQDRVNSIRDYVTALQNEIELFRDRRVVT